ncbi:MPH1 [[Candida] subhashii]|uniref:ATP-dependent DNA helicase n=1 Tax=[Candida] subhashii TaxID=561895 RepID=A0A8J5QIM8_9ASCO|nr:MPH1 [[Candida] subhashii]KAG7661920.1 MPH1 [[Candida] subhashii]
MPVIPIDDDDEDGSWSFNDEDDPELEALIQTNATSSRNHLPQRTLEGSIVPQELITKDQYEEIPLPTRVNVPTHHQMDFQKLHTYIYPTNFEVRDYQFNIVQRAFYDNLLVALPTGLGKTFIASTVMLNFLRWFPQSKFIFVAPTRPLVAQQIKACCSIAGIPSSKVAILLDKTRKNRADIWDSKQVFFTTPQVVENDLASGLVNPKSIALLVIDEAHRARGNYSYNNVVKFLKRFNDSFRILALTATPAADVDGVQDIIDNLDISKVEVRTEQSIDIIKYMKRKRIERRIIPPSSDIEECVTLLSEAIAPVLTSVNERGLLSITDPKRINHFQCMEAGRRLAANRGMPAGLKWANYYMLQLLGMVGQCYKRLNIYGIKSFFNYFNEKYTEFKSKWDKKKSKNKLNADFFFSEQIEELLKRSEEMVKGSGYSHPKIEALMDELEVFFAENSSSDSRVIIFTEYRESALEIVQSIEKAGDNRKPHIFIGQAPEKERFDETAEKPAKGKGKAKGAKTTKSKKKKNGGGIDDNDESAKSSTRTSSEDAQIKGMNQKLQKEIIKKFKEGTYNILVATSIGEEGLDIGEVDLIVCYDSTSSPIKNIQRMGRTGRKRDGKVVLLFSGNEESKFDKAMGGYEYIQQHIMKGDLITLRPQNRIIPKEYTPEVVKEFIEIPPENLELKAEDDEDEIIRIATQYMLGGKTDKKSKQKKPTKQKTFFMPDNVETGFRSVTSMIRKVGDDKSLEERNKEKQTNQSGTNKNRLGLSSDDSESDSDLFMSDIIKQMDAKRGSSPNTSTIVEKNASNSITTVIRENSTSNILAGYIPGGNAIGITKKTLGVKRQYVAPPPIIVKETRDIDPIIINENIKEPAKTVAIPIQGHIAKDDTMSPIDLDDDDDFEFSDDDLEEYLKVTGPKVVSDSPTKQSKVSDRVYQFDFAQDSGLLNEEETMDLHMNYYMPLDPDLRVDFYNPSDALHRNENTGMFSIVNGGLSHSRKTHNLINALNTKPIDRDQLKTNDDMMADIDFSFVVED